MKTFSITEVNEKDVLLMTREGHRARIICQDALGSKPIVALVTERYKVRHKEELGEIAYFYDKEGRVWGQDGKSDYDLFIAESEDEIKIR